MDYEAGTVLGISKGQGPHPWPLFMVLIRLPQVYG